MGRGKIVRERVEQVDGPIDAFCGGVGTGGMLIGVYVRCGWPIPGIRIVGLELASSAVTTTGTPGAYHVEGIGVGFVPPLLTPSEYDEVRAIDEGESRATSRRLAREERISAGTSSGLDVTAALALTREHGPGKRVVTVAADSGLTYLAGDLYQD